MVKTESSLDTSWLPAPPWGQGIRERMTLSSTYVHKETCSRLAGKIPVLQGVDNNHKIEVLQNVTALIILHLQLHSHWPICQDFLFGNDKRSNKLFCFPLLLY